MALSLDVTMLGELFVKKDRIMRELLAADSSTSKQNQFFILMARILNDTCINKKVLARNFHVHCIAQIISQWKRS